MDKVWTFLAKIRKHHFWLVCVFLLGLAIPAWLSGTSKLDKAFATNKTAIDGKFGAAEGVKNKPEHPNQSLFEKMAEIINSRRTSVEQAWKHKWERQQAILTWPEKFVKDLPQFLEKVRPYRTIEELPENFTLATYMREQYAEYIKQEMPELAKRIGASWVVNLDNPEIEETPTGGSSYGGYGMPGMGRGMGMGMGMGGGYGSGIGGRSYSVIEGSKNAIVDWNPENQKEILSTHFDFSSREDHAPQVEDIYLTQETLWVLRSIMDIIKTTNGDADARHLAVIKSINFIRVGKDAVGQAGTVEEVKSTAAADPMMGSADGGMSYGMGGMGGMGGVGGGMPYGGYGMPGGGDSYGAGGFGGFGGFGTESVDINDPLDGRYVDKDYNKLTKSDLEGARQSMEPEQAYLAIAKRMPIRMRFKMDTRHIDRLLVACANSPLTLEVRQLRLDRPPAPAPGKTAADTTSSADGEEEEEVEEEEESEDGGMSRSPYGGYGGMPGMYGGGRMPGGMPGMPGMGGYGEEAELTAGPAFPYDKPVEIYGIVYIFNPPNPARLGETVAADGDASGLAAAPAPVR